MKNRLLLSCLLLSLVVILSGCDRIGRFFGKKADTPVVTEEVPAAAAPSPEGAPAATPTPPPAPATPEPVAINRNASVIVLCYHRFEENPKDDLAISPAEFEEQLKALKENGVEVIRMQDFLAWRRGEKNIPARSAVITIDDGYISGYSVAWPLLKKYDLPFTMFVYIEYIASGGKAISWEQLAEMRDAGVDIQSHTYSHQSLRGRPPGLNRKAIQEIKEMGHDAWLKREVAGSKDLLEQQLAIRVSALAYPYGMYNQAARDAIKAAGYEAAFTVYGQRVGFSTPEHDLIGRYAVGSRKPEIFAAALRAVATPGSEPEHAGPVVAQVAAASMATQPMDGQTIADPRPVIRANLATMGEIDPGSVEMRISGYGLVKAQYDPQTRIVSFQPGKPLSDKHYTVILSAMAGGKKVETRWSFSFDPSAPAKPVNTDLPASATPAP